MIFTRRVSTPKASAATSFSRIASMARPSYVAHPPDKPGHHPRADKANQAYRCAELRGRKKGGRLMLAIPSGPPVNAIQLVLIKV